MPDAIKQGGGRIASDQYRALQALCDEFTGLPAGVGRYDLLLLVKKAGKSAGFTPRMIQLLDYYMAYTRDQDWEEGALPVIYQSLAKTALDLGVTERQIQYLEKQLFQVGALTWLDSGNHKRYGVRDERTGRILFAFGVNLAPLAALRERLEQAVEDKALHDRAWMETKRKISYYRAQIRGVLAEQGALIEEAEEGAALSQEDVIAYAARYEAIAYKIRTYITLADLRALQTLHETLWEEISQRIEKERLKPSSRDEINNSHYKYTTQQSSNKLDTPKGGRATPKRLQKTRSDIPDLEKDRTGQGAESSPAEPDIDLLHAAGLQHITTKQLLNTGSERFREAIPMRNRAMEWRDLVEAAQSIRRQLGVPNTSWEACEDVLGIVGAVTCLVLTDQAAQRAEDPVKIPAAYFNALVNRAKRRELNLHNSIFGILKREEGGA